MSDALPWAREVAARACSRQTPAPAFVSQSLRNAPKVYTLVVVDDGARVLLGHKKTGLGAGLYHGFGGKVEPGETVVEAALRELREEASIQAEGLTEAGVLVAIFRDQPQPCVSHVFRAARFTGTPIETEEARPEWFPHADLPFDRMWPQARHWYTFSLRGERFRALLAVESSRRLTWHAVQGEEGGACAGPAGAGLD